MTYANRVAGFGGRGGFGGPGGSGFGGGGPGRAMTIWCAAASTSIIPMARSTMESAIRRSMPRLMRSPASPLEPCICAEQFRRFRGRAAQHS